MKQSLTTACNITSDLSKHGYMVNAKGILSFSLIILTPTVVFSHCPEHAWQLRKFNPTKHSIFALGEVAKEEEEEEEVEEEAAYNQLEIPELVVDESVLPSSEMPSESAICSSVQKSLSISQNLKLGRSFVVCGGNARAM